MYRRTETKATEGRQLSALPAGAVPADLELAFVNTDLGPYRRASAKPPWPRLPSGVVAGLQGVVF